MRGKGNDVKRFSHAVSEIPPSLPDRVPWNTLKPASIVTLLTQSATVALRRGDEALVELGIVLSGAFAIEQHLSDGRRVLSELFHEGHVVDLRRSGRMRQGRLVALKPSTILAIDERWHEHSIVTDTDIAAAMMTQQREQVASQRDHVADLAVKTPFERLASVLFELQRWPDAAVDGLDEASLRIPLQRVDLADYIGVKPETLSRAVRCLERERLIQLPTPTQIILTNLPAVRRIANGGRPRRSTKRG